MVNRSAGARSTRTFFALGEDKAGHIAVCRGLSCETSGAAALFERVAGQNPVVPVYCLGQCDRSPAMLLPEGLLRTGEQALRWPAESMDLASPGRVDVRSVARRAVVTERIGQGCFARLDKALQAGVYSTLTSFLTAKPADVLDIITASGERGRGGAGFVTGEKWRLCAAGAGPRYVVANGDEGDPGSFLDRILMEDDPHALLEGLALCAYAVGAAQGIVFVRAEYPQARASMAQAIIEAREAGLLGTSVLGSPFSFDVHIVGGHGSYVCGEETALLNAIEGRRGEVRVRPPYPATAGLHGRPTVVNNIETLINVPWILREGADAFRRLGTADSPGTKAFCLNRGFQRPGIVEAEFGITLRELVEGHGQGCSNGAAWRAIALGGPMGSLLSPMDLDVHVDYPVLRRHGIRLGHGGLVIIPTSVDLHLVLRNWAAFMADESCGKCTPCALGSARVLDLARQLSRGGEGAAAAQRDLLGLLQVIESSSLCGFGQGVPGPIRSLVRMIGALPQSLEAEAGG